MTTSIPVHVTGGSGFLGLRVLRLLAEAGTDTFALARSDRSEQIVSEAGAVAVRGDLDDGVSSLARCFSEGAPHALINLASLGFGHAESIVAAAEQAGIRRAVFVSTTAIFTGLAAPSRAVRVAAENAIRQSTLDWTILRPTMIYGAAGDRNMARLLRALSQIPVFPLPGGGRGLQQPVHVDDLADAVVACVDRPATIGRSYDIPGPEPITFRHIVEEAGRAVGRRPVLVPIPLPAAVAAARLAARMPGGRPITTEQVERLGEDKVFDPAPARADLGFAPRSFTAGIVNEALALR